MNSVILLKDFRGLDKGTELIADPRTDSYVFTTIDENIGDHVYSVQRNHVSVSSEFVNNLLGDLFIYPTTRVKEALCEEVLCEDCEVSQDKEDVVEEKSEHQVLIEKYEGMLAELQAELKNLKK